ncbi:MAG: flagellar basal body-associated FliL family protein [Actinomycetota bacterium]
MAEETTDEEAAEAAAKAKKKKMIIGIVVGGALLYNFVLKGSPPPEDETVAGAAPVEVVVEEGEIAPLEELVVNLADQDELHYLRVGVGAVLSIDFALADVEPMLPKVNDIVIDVVSQKTFTELRIPGSTTALKEEISAAVAEAFPEGEVVRVIFTTYVMQ